MPTVPVKAAGWRIEPPVSVAVAPKQSRGDRRGRPAGGAARHEARLVDPTLGLAPPGRHDRTEIGRLVRRAHREFVEVELAQHGRAVAPKVRRHGRFVGRHEAFQDVARRRRLDALGAIEVLDAERYALERPRVARGKAGVRRLRLGQGEIRRLDDEAVERLRRLDGGDLGVGKLDGGKTFGREPVAGSGERKSGEIGHGRILIIR
jgi:hypothetical protein